MKLKFTETQFTIVKQSLPNYVTAYDSKRGRIFVKCTSDAQMITAWDVIEKTDINPSKIDYCSQWSF